jgi:hypothetical protein
VKGERWIGNWWGEAPVRHRNYSGETCECYDRLLLGLREGRAVSMVCIAIGSYHAAGDILEQPSPLKRSTLKPRGSAALRPNFAWVVSRRLPCGQFLVVRSLTLPVLRPQSRNLRSLRIVNDSAV